MGSVLEAFDNAYRCESVKGPHVKVGESGVSGKVIWENERGDENILYCPISTTRTLARWSDRGESVDRDFDGPDLGVLIQVPDKNSSSPFIFMIQPRLPTMIWTTASRITYSKSENYLPILILTPSWDLEKRRKFRKKTYSGNLPMTGLRITYPCLFWREAGLNHLPDVEFTRISSSKAQGGTTSEY